MNEPIVDYFSFSVPTPRMMKQFDLMVSEEIPYNFTEEEGGIAHLLGSQQNWHEIKKSGIFDRGIRFPDIGASYFDGDKSNVSLIQFSGVGCAWLREEGYLETLINDWKNRCTRIDIAIDIECDVEPEIFVRQRTTQRFKISGHREAQSGVTWYVGSRSSDRFARVYRYFSPHPRSKYLRIEYELHDEQAKLVSEMLIRENLHSVVDRLGQTFGWSHPVYVQRPDAQKLPSAPRTETKGNTVFWLHKQVLPALRKSAEKGDLETLIAFESSIRAIINEYSNP